MSANNASELSEVLITVKLEGITTDLRELRELLTSQSYEVLVSDFKHSTLAERLLERIVNRAIDINQHLIRAVGAPPPKDYTLSFIELGRQKILSPELAVAIAPAAGARNILVHEYDDLDTKKFYTSLQDAVRLFPEYVRAITAYVDRSTRRRRDP